LWAASVHDGELEQGFLNLNERNGAEGQLLRVNGIAMMRSLIKITVFLSLN
jgi:hypothetical protein